jgi:hypothetical protein
MRYLFVLFFLGSFFVFSQKVKYTGGILQVNNKNFGKNVTVVYDDFFDSYSISYTNSNGFIINERYDGSMIQIIAPRPTFICMSINGTGKFISRLKKQK